jgi:ubiquinone/menaquinone biosynthesis C-methylase UbiE
LPAAPRVLDIACGPGMQTMDLARLLPDAEIVAIDTHTPFLAEVDRRARAAGVAGRVRTVEADMRALPFDDSSFDLLWCEGAAYLMGVAEALRAWRRLLRPGGRVALSDAVWLCPDPPAAVRRWWAEYPEMRDLAGCRALVAESGYRLLGDLILPAESWCTHYYDPVATRLAELAPNYAGDPVAEAVLQEARDEIAIQRDFADTCGYAFLVAAPQ